MCIRDSFLGIARPDHGEPTGAGRGDAVPVGDLLPYAGTAGCGGGFEGEAGEVWEAAAADCYADRAGDYVLARGGLSPAILGEARGRFLPYLRPVRPPFAKTAKSGAPERDKCVKP